MKPWHSWDKAAALKITIKSLKLVSEGFSLLLSNSRLSTKFKDWIRLFEIRTSSFSFLRYPNSPIRTNRQSRNNWWVEISKCCLDWMRLILPKTLWCLLWKNFPCMAESMFMATLPTPHLTLSKIQLKLHKWIANLLIRWTLEWTNCQS